MRIALSLTVSTVALALATPAMAQDAPQSTEQAVEEESGGFGDIVVTAQKRGENLQRVPVSVSAFSGEQLERLRATSTTEITQQIPGMHLNAWSPTLTIFALRGVSQNNFQDNLEAPVAAYMDNAYVGTINGVSGQLFDTKRVEVLRGPQGTLFGRNATGGLVHYLSNDASRDEFNGYVEAGYGRFDDWSIEGAAGGSLTPGIRLRAAGRVERADGYIKSVDTFPGLPGSGQDLGGKDGWAARVNLQFDLSPAATLSLWYKHSEDNDVATGGYVFDNCDLEGNGYCHVNAAGVSDGTSGVINGITGAPASPWEHFGERPGHLNRNVNIYQGDLTWDLGGGIEFTSITNYLDLKKDYGEDGDALPVLVINFDTDIRYKQFSQELRLTGKGDRLSWQAGFYYLNVDMDGAIRTEGAPVLGAAIGLNGAAFSPFTRQSYAITSKNWSIFGQADYKLTDQLTLTVGGRYSKDNKRVNYSAILSDPGNFPDTLLASSGQFATAVPGIDRINYGDWAGRVALNYQANDNSILFASWNRGIKGGNWTFAADVTPPRFRHDPETLNSFEAGFKTALFDRTLRLNGTLFHYDYNDYQAFALTGGTGQVTNADGKSTGAELELFWSPSPRFDAILGGTWQQSSFDNVQGPGTQIGPEFFPGAPDTQYCANQGGFFLCQFPQSTISGAKLPNAPRFSANYLFRYNFDIAGGNAAVQFDGAWYDDQFLEITNGPSSLQPSYNVSNASVSWTDDDTGIGVTGWVKNVFNTEFTAYTLNLGILGTTSYFAPPRTYGVSLRIPFGAN